MGDEPPTVLISGIKECDLKGSSFKRLFNSQCVAYINWTEVMVFEVKEDLTLGRQGQILDTGKVNIYADLDPDNDNCIMNYNKAMDTFGEDKIIVLSDNSYLRVYRAKLRQSKIEIKKLHGVTVNGVEGE